MHLKPGCRRATSYFLSLFSDYGSFAMSSHTASERIELPLRPAGGGSASEASSHSTITGFPQDGHMLQQLRNVYQNLPQGEPFQEISAIRDEESFLSYMASPQSAAMGPPPAITRDLTYPLSSYYISSSHNTYLSGNQLYGEASTEAYTDVLQRGCRCLEIDVWDGEDSDTSASSSDEETELSATRARSKDRPKPSRWSKMKAKAVQIRGSSPSKERSKLVPNTASPPTHGDRLSPSLSQEKQFPKSEPRVLHGYTLTQSVPFREVCQRIAESAFSVTKLPLIVSLEVHANLDQQQTMVQIMKETWKGHLIDASSLSDRGLESLPSVEAVKEKILIKVKWTPDSQTGESNDPSEKATSVNGQFPGQTSTTQKKASKILHDLSQLGVYTRAYTFKQWDQPEASIPTHVFSLSEGKVRAMHGDPSHGPALFNHNRDFLMRVFPKGTRIRSSNVDPTFHWRQGAQMVALNWQSVDKGMMLNEGMFADQEGWVLKPFGFRTRKSDSLRGHAESTKASPVPVKQLLDLKIQLLSGQDIPFPIEKESSHRPKIKPYVKAELHVDTHGPPGQQGFNPTATSRTGAYPEDDHDEKKYKFRSKTQRSCSPNFEGETIAWSSVPDVVEELSFLR